MSDQNASYISERIVEYFDEIAVGEWERLVASPVAEVSLHLQTLFANSCQTKQKGA